MDWYEGSTLAMGVGLTIIEVGPKISRIILITDVKLYFCKKFKNEYSMCSMEMCTKF